MKAYVKAMQIKAQNDDDQPLLSFLWGNISRLVLVELYADLVLFLEEKAVLMMACR